MASININLRFKRLREKNISKPEFVGLSNREQRNSKIKFMMPGDSMSTNLKQASNFFSDQSRVSTD